MKSPPSPSLGTVGQVGARFLPNMVDTIARWDPDRILYSIANTNDPADGFTDISATVFARAVDRCAWFIHYTLGRGEEFPTIAYMGPQDIVYLILTLACHKTGYAPLYNSPRERLDVHLHLLEKTGCDVFLSAPNFPLPVIKQILDARPMRAVELPGPRHWLEDREDDMPPYSHSVPWEQSFADVKSEPFVIVHTSGSTGMPKPITLTHGTVAPMDCFTRLPSLGQAPTFPALCKGKRVYFSTPFFHSAGICLSLPGCIYSGFTAVIGPFPPSPAIANGIHVHGGVSYSVLAPFTLMELVKTPEYVKNLAILELLIYGGGGQLPQETAQILRSRVRLLNCLGSTECGVFPIQLTDPEDWAYLKVSKMLGQQYRHIAGDLYEQVIVRDDKLQKFQGVFSTFPDIDEWHMKDVYSKHPSKDDVWLYRGRADDIIVFSTGEKMNPFDVEGIILGDPLVNMALVAGFGRFQSSLLIEPSTSPTSDGEKEALIEKIWPTIELANQKCPSFGKIHRNMILFTSSDKPMPRASKGTPQRQLTLNLYAPELDALYAENEKSLGDGTSRPKSGSDLKSDLSAIISESTDNIDVSTLDPDTDLFECGLDSLQVTIITRKLNRLLRSRGSSQQITTGIVYSNPTVSGLLAVLSRHLGDQSAEQMIESDDEKMQRFYETSVADLPITARAAQPIPADKLVVLLTGATGSLGSYILRSLIENEHVSKIYCLNRGSNSSKRVQASQSAKGLGDLSAKVVCLDADLSQSYFDLDKHGDYTTLLNEVTTIIHGAWQVDFKLSLDSFRGHVATVRRLIDFSAHSRFGAGIFFISSIGAVFNWEGGSPDSEQSDKLIPEEIFSDFTVPAPIGYARSKFVAERLLDAAAREAGVPATICRVGQIAGPTTRAGSWPRQEWLPSLLAGSKIMGKLPATLGRGEVIDWIPVDVLGRVVVELMLETITPSKRNEGAVMFHTSNPKATTWADMLPVIQKRIQADTIPLEQWVDELSRSAAAASDNDNAARNPAAMLVDYYGSLIAGKHVCLDITKTAAASQTLRSLEAVHEWWMDNWMRQWGL